MPLLIMEKIIKIELLELIKESRYLTSSWYYVQGDIYKQLDIIYEANQKEVVDILYDMALDVNIKNFFESISYVSILGYLLLEHERANDNVTCVKDAYRKMVLEIFKNNDYVKLRGSEGLMFVGFTKDEAEDLFRKYIKTETDPATIKKYKYEILQLESSRLFPKHSFAQTICILELHDTGKDKINTLQDNINNRIKDYDVKIVRKWIKLFLNHEYLSEAAKDILRLVK